MYAFVIVHILFYFAKNWSDVNVSLFASIPVRIKQNNQIFLKDSFAIRRIIKIF